MMYKTTRTFLFLIMISSIFTVPAIAVEKAITDKAADYICVKAKEGGKTRLAVYPFTTKDGSTSADTEAYETKIIEIILTKGEFRVIDPSKVSKIVEEQEKGLTGLVDPDTAPETGKMLGADAMIFGITGDGLIQIRILDAVSGEVIGATVADSGGSAKVSSEDFQSKGNRDRFFAEQAEGKLGELFRKHPAMFLIATADENEMKELESEFPRLVKETEKKLMNSDPKKADRFEARKKKLLKMRKENPAFDGRIREMRGKALETMKSKKKKKQ